MIRVLASLLALTAVAHAQTAALKSFSYESTGCYSGGDFLTWGSKDEFRMNFTHPGAGELPSGSYWVRAVSLTFVGTEPDQYALIGHSGPNGDWISPPVMSGDSKFVTFPLDAAPLVKPGEHLDVHAKCSSSRRGWALVSIWYVPVQGLSHSN